MAKERKAGASGGNAAAEPQIVLGIDPGVSCHIVALSLVSTAARLFVARPVKIDGVRVPRLPDGLLSLANAIVFIEHVQGRDGWGASSTFALGGHFLGMAALCHAQHWDVRFVRPMAWKRGLAVELGSGEPKADTYRRYLELWPHEPLPQRPVADGPNHNAVDAMMIAAFGAQSLGYPIRPWKFPITHKIGARKVKSYE